MPDLVVVVPSRGRPEAVAELERQCEATCTADTAMVVVVDADDPTLPKYGDVLTTTGRGHVAAINHGAAYVLDEFKPFAIAKLDDDHRPRSRGWDERFLAELHAMGTGVVYGNDLYQGANLPTAPAMTADIVAALGYMGPPTLTHLYVDVFWKDLGTDAGCLRYLPDVVIEHMHPMAGKSPWTEGHRRVNHPEMFAADGAAYGGYRSVSLAQDVAKVRALRSVASPVGG